MITIPTDTTMKVTEKDVEHVAKLARLGLTEEEKKLYTDQLNRILEYADRINQLPTEGVEPTFHTLPIRNVLREDSVAASKDAAAIFTNAPSKEANMFRVPRILE